MIGRDTCVLYFYGRAVTFFSQAKPLSLSNHSLWHQPGCCCVPHLHNFASRFASGLRFHRYACGKSKTLNYSPEIYNTGTCKSEWEVFSQKVIACVGVDSEQPQATVFDNFLRHIKLVRFENYILSLLVKSHPLRFCGRKRVPAFRDFLFPNPCHFYAMFFSLSTETKHTLFCPTTNSLRKHLGCEDTFPCSRFRACVGRLSDHASVQASNEALPRLSSRSAADTGDAPIASPGSTLPALPVFLPAKTSQPPGADPGVTSNVWWRFL